MRLCSYTYMYVRSCMRVRRCIIKFCTNISRAEEANIEGSLLFSVAKMNSYGKS